MTTECNDCIYRNNWNEQSNHLDCNLDNDASNCKDYKTRQQFEQESIPEWLKNEIESNILIVLPVTTPEGYDETDPLDGYDNGWNVALEWVLSLTKPEE